MSIAILHTEAIYGALQILGCPVPIERVEGRVLLMCGATDAVDNITDMLYNWDRWRPWSAIDEVAICSSWWKIASMPLSLCEHVGSEGLIMLVWWSMCEPSERKRGNSIRHPHRSTFTLTTLFGVVVFCWTILFELSATEKCTKNHHMNTRMTHYQKQRTVLWTSF